MPGLSHRKKQLIRTFHFEVRRLLSESERRALFHALKEFQRSRQVEKLVIELRDLLHSPEKLDLLRHIRDLIPRSHITEFDGYFRQSSRQTPKSTIQRRRPPGRHSPELITRPQSHERVFDSMPQGDVMVITIQKGSQDANLGFSVRGGAEHGLGIYVSEIESGCLAEVSGLEIGDKILEVNNIGLEDVTSSGAVKVLTGSSKLKLVVERTGQLPQWRLSREKVTWYDSHTKMLMVGEYEEGGGSAYIRGLETAFPERRVTMSITSRHKELGFNIRGGMEYGIGIYISKVDKGSIAARNGVRVGDQIMEVNGIPFNNISHPNAVDILRSETHLILTLRDMGRYPAYKELYAEYAWNNHGTISSSRTGTLLSKMSRQTKLRDMCLDKGSQRNRGLHLRVPIQSGIYSGHEESNELPLQSEIYLPHVQGSDGAKSDSWTYGPIQIETLPGGTGSKAKRSKVQGSVNPAYLPEGSDSDTLSVSSATDTDDSSGIHGEYDITMDDIIARGDDLGEVKINMEDNPGVSGVVELVDLKTQCMESLSDMGSVDSDSDHNHDEAVLILNPVGHSSDTNSMHSNEDYPDRGEDRMEQSEVVFVNHELSPLSHSIDIDSDCSPQPSVNSENVTNNHQQLLSVNDNIYNMATKRTLPKTKTVSYMEVPTTYSPQLYGTDSEEGSEWGRGLQEGSQQDRAHEERSQQDWAHKEGSQYDRAHKEGPQQDWAHEEGSQYDGAHKEGSQYDRAHKEGPQQDWAHEEGSQYDGAHKEGSQYDGAHKVGSQQDWAHEEESEQGRAHVEVSGHRRSHEDGSEEGRGRVVYGGEEEGIVITIQDEDENDVGRGPPVGVASPYEIRLEDDEDLMCVMQNFDEQIRDLEQRQSNIGVIEMTTLSPEEQMMSLHPDNLLDVPGRKEDSIISGKWKAIKEKLKGSLRLSKPEKYRYEKEMEKRDALDPRGSYYGSMRLHKNSIVKSNIALLRDEAKKLLDSDEYAAVIRHMESYHSSRDLDRMIDAILPILDKPEKMLLLRDIRGVLYATDLGRFDTKVNLMETEAYEKLSTKLHLQLNHVNKGKKPKKHLLMTEIESGPSPEPDESGHFYIKTVEQHEQEQRIKQHVVDVMSGGSLKSSPHGTLRASGTESPSGIEMDFMDNFPQGDVMASIPKDKPTLGLCVSGGSNSKRQPEVRVDRVLEGGAAADAHHIQPGMTILAVNDKSMVGVSHKEAVNILKMAFSDRSTITMEIKLRQN